MESIDRQALWRLVGQCTAAGESRAPGLTTRFDDGSWMVLTEADAWLFNWLVCHALTDTTTETIASCLDEIVASGRVSSLVFAESVREHVPALVAGRPIVLDGNPPMMWRDANPLPPNPRSYPGTIRRASSPEDIRQAWELIARSFEVDPAESVKAMSGMLADPAMTMYLGTTDALDSVCLTYTPAEISYVHVLATHPDRQRRGAGRAALTTAMNEATARGCEQFFLMSSSAGQPLYRALGYDTYELAEYWTVNPKEEGE